MNHKDLIRGVCNTPIKQRVGEQRESRSEGNSYYSRNDKENAVIEALDQRQTLIRHAEWLEKLRSGKVDIPQFLAGVSPEVIVQLLDLAMNGSDKVKLGAITDLLDRAGYGKVNKHAIASVDSTSSKESLISLILGAKKDLKDTVEIVDDENQAE